MVKNGTIFKATHNINFAVWLADFLISLIQVTEHKFAFSLIENNWRVFIISKTVCKN